MNPLSEGHDVPAASTFGAVRERVFLLAFADPGFDIELRGLRLINVMPLVTVSACLLSKSILTLVVLTVLLSLQKFYARTH